MKHVFVSTANARRFLAGIAALKDRGAGEACLMVVDGEPGLSKSAVTGWWAVQEGALFLRAKKEWTPAWMLRELLAGLSKEPPGHSFEKMYKQALNRLAQAATEAARDDRSFAVVIDEADYISRYSRLLDTVRDLSDMLEIPFILVGMGRIRHHLPRFPQVASRVGQAIEFEPLSLEDTRAMVEKLCDVEVAEDLIEYLHRVSKGYAREIKDAIAPIERYGLRNPGPVTLAGMDGQVLLTDRASGKPIKVRSRP